MGFGGVLSGGLRGKEVGSMALLCGSGESGCRRFAEMRCAVRKGRFCGGAEDSYYRGLNGFTVRFG